MYQKLHPSGVRGDGASNTLCYARLVLNPSLTTFRNLSQDLIDGKCEKRRKGVFGPAAGKKFVIFVDDVNMPQREFYGAQPPIEILRYTHIYIAYYTYREKESLRERKGRGARERQRMPHCGGLAQHSNGQTMKASN